MADRGDRRRTAEEFVPASDWSQDDKAHYLLVDLPGFKKEQLRIELDSSGHLTISGERMVNEKKSVYFEQIFSLPENSDTDNISGRFDGGILYVTVPRKTVVEEHEQKESGINGNYANSLNGETSLDKEPNNHGENQRKHEEKYGDDQHEQRGFFEEKHGDDLHEQRGDKEGKGEIISNETCRVSSFPQEMIKKWEEDDGPWEMAMKFLKKNKGVVLTVVVAVSIGVLMYRTYESRDE
ncbi:hypothetical protein DITRI_Ditri04bG0056300 [Diplodiscus trichospermus]